MIEAAVSKDPDVLTSGRFYLPAYVEADPEARARAMARLAQAAADAYAQRVGS